MKPLFEAMVPLHKALAPESPRTELVHASEFEASSKKRKWEEPFVEEFFKDQTNSETKKPVFELELHVDTPFSTENKWPQFLSIQAGQIRLCNTRVNKTTTAEECSRRNPEPPPPPPPPHHHMGLDLDLNLTCESLRKRDGDHHSHHVNVKQVSGSPDSDDLRGEHERKKGSDDDHQSGLIRTPSWLSSEGDHKEMVATVCMRCHMLVMLCKSSPSCPNCKFMHPPDQNPSKFLKRRCSLFC